MVKEVKGVLLEFASTVAETSLIIPVPIVNSLELPKSNLSLLTGTSLTIQLLPTGCLQALFVLTMNSEH